MRLNLLIFVAVVLPSSLNARSIQNVDLGFSDTDTYVSTDLALNEGREAWAFRLASRSTNRVFRLNHCRYYRPALEREIANIRDERVRADFSWVLMQSGYSSAPLHVVYPELKALLERIRPECEVPPLARALRSLH